MYQCCYRGCRVDEETQELLRPLQDRSVDPKSLEGKLLTKAKGEGQESAGPPPGHMSEEEDTAESLQTDGKGLKIEVTHEWHF
jgi:hypothetical protein